MPEVSNQDHERASCSFIETSQSKKTFPPI